MDLNDIKVLEFRDELINLLRKYNFQLYGHGDELRLKTDFNDYRVDDYINIYKEREIDNGYTEDNLLELYIKGALPKEVEEMGGLNNIKIQCAVICSDEHLGGLKIEKLAKEIGAENIKYLSRNAIWFNDNDRIVFVKPNYQAKGYRFQKCYFNSNGVTKEIVDNVILPISRCSKDTFNFFK